MLKKCWAIFAVGVMPLAVAAQAPVCPNMTGAARVDCLAEESKRVDLALEKIMKKVAASVDSSVEIPEPERQKWKQKILESQRTYESYVRQDCDEIEFYFWWGGAGSGAGSATLSCVIDKNTARLNELKSRYHVK